MHAKARNKQKRRRTKEPPQPSRIDGFDEEASSKPSQQHRKKKRRKDPSDGHAQKKFLTAHDGDRYRTLLRDHYAGFCHVPGSQIAAPFHQSAKLALEKLRDSGYYQYDMVLAGGSILSRTFVQRCLIGEPGITYKYLGLRLFAHAWSGPNALPQFRSIYDMNQAMIRLTQQQQLQKQQAGSSGPVGSCQYNLTLINYMEPASDALLRDEESYGMGKASVSWHADSSLQDYSAIGVYHTLPTQRAAMWDWKIALRKNPDDDGTHNTAANHKNDAQEDPSKQTVPPVVVSTKSGDAYFLLGDFNHTHQHMVLAGSTAHRISSTHRVAEVEHDTYEYIRNRVSHALKSLKAELKKSRLCDWDAAVVLESQAVLTEVEFEWIAQYWVQGAQHDVQHVWWQAPMRALEEAWGALERLTYKVHRRVVAVQEEGEEVPTRQVLLKGMVAAFRARQELRTKWDERRANKIYKRRIARPFQPVEHPVFDDDDDDASSNKKKRLTKDLTESIRTLQQALSALLSSSRSAIGSTSKHFKKAAPRKQQQQQFDQQQQQQRQRKGKKNKFRN